MTPDQDACALLYRHWREGTVLEALPPDLRPADRAQAYKIQAFLEDYSAAPLFGWKIAATGLAGQRHIGVDGPLAGRLLAERVIADGGECALGANRMRVAELEFAFRMGSDLTPRDTDYTQDDVLAAVASLHPAIELPDSRFAHFETAGLPQLVAATMPAAICSCWGPPPMRHGATWTLPPIPAACSGMAPWRKTAAAAMCWAIPASP